MAYYDLPKEERKILKKTIENSILLDLQSKEYESIVEYSSDDDTYIRKNVYLGIGKFYKQVPELRKEIFALLETLLDSPNENVRQTVVYALGEIGKSHFDKTTELLERAFDDPHHKVLNAVTGALKQLGERNPQSTLTFIKTHLPHCTAKVRLKLLHGLELRGRTHPEDVLPILENYQHDAHKNVIKMVIHVLGQISYKEGCLETVVQGLKNWDNANLVTMALQEILDVHQNYSKFCAVTTEEAIEVIRKGFPTVS
jgi:hypothetical protein